MFGDNKEKGYALIIVLFSIIFITSITAVFMRGALSNIAQENTVDENNLVVVAAESGVKYYTYELKKAYNEVELQELLDESIEDAIEAKQNPINYDNIQNILVAKVKSNMKKTIKNIEEVQKVGSYDMSDEYQHELTISPPDFAINSSLTSPIISEEKLDNGDVQISLKGKVKGEQKVESFNDKKEKELTFDLIFYIPKLNPNLQDKDNEIDDDSNVNNNQFITLSTPKLPSKISEMDKPENNKMCIEKAKITNITCLFPKNSIGTLESIQDNSNVYFDSIYNAWRDLGIQNSYFYINGASSGGPWDVQKSKFYSKGSVNKGGSFKLHDSSAYVGGDFKESEKVDFQNSSILIEGAFSVSSQDSKIHESIMSVGLDFKSSSTISIQKSHLTIGGMMKFPSGGSLQDSYLKIGKQLDAPSKLHTKDSELSIGGHLQLSEGADIQGTKIIINSYMNSPSAVEIQKSKLFIGGYLKINSDSKFSGSKISIDGEFESPVKIEIQDSTILAKSTDIGVLDLQDTKFCSEDFKVSTLKMQDSKVYYLNSTNKTGKDIIQLPKDEYEKKCGFSSSDNSTEEPQLPGKIDWSESKPVIEKVEY